MTTPAPIPHLDEPAQQLARIRRLERDLEAERANVARERRSNGMLALELFEARELAKALAAEVEQLKAATNAEPPDPPVTKERAIAYMMEGGTISADSLRRKIENGKPLCQDHEGGDWYECPLHCMTKEPGFYTLLPLENGAAG